MGAIFGLWAWVPISYMILNMHTRALKFRALLDEEKALEVELALN